MRSFFWWGHVFSIALALAHVLVVSRLRRFRDLAVPTLVFHMTIGAIAGFLFLRLHYGAPDVVAALSVIRKLLNDVTMAALIDLSCAICGLDLVRGRIFRRPTVRLARLMPAMVFLIVLASTMVLYLNNVYQFSRDFVQSRAEVALRAEVDIRRLSAHGNANPSVVHQVSADGAAPRVMIASSAGELIRSRAMESLGCTRLDDGAPVSGPNDRNTFSYWLSACPLGHVQVAGHDYAYLYSARPLAEEAYSDALTDMGPPSIILAIALLLQFIVSRGVERSLEAWRQVLDGFGRPGIVQPRGLLFTEFESPIGAIVTANNRFAALVEERRRLADAVIQLKDEMDLTLASDIRFDRTEGVLHFTEISIDCPATDGAIAVHPSDRIALAGICSASEAFAEFRIDEGAQADWYLLSARDLVAPGQWRSGWIVRLRQSKLSHDRLLQQARLIELGGMASALSHELKQPLFTISLSSENGRLLIDQGTPEAIGKARGKFDRIIDQVTRSRDIISRISRYSRIEDEDHDPVEIGEVINTALTFMRPLMVQKNVGIRTDLPDPVMVRAPRVGIEQLLVNAIQNSVDAIVSRREAERSDFEGEISVTLTTDEKGLQIRIADNGTGFEQLDPGSAFGAFVTSKPADKGTGLGLYISRQIVMEMGGRIGIDSRPAPERGAVMTVDLPAKLIAGREPDMLPPETVQ